MSKNIRNSGHKRTMFPIYKIKNIGKNKGGKIDKEKRERAGRR